MGGLRLVRLLFVLDLTVQEGTDQSGHRQSGCDAKAEARHGSAAKNPSHKQETGALLKIRCCDKARGVSISFMGSVSDEQRWRSAKDPQPFGLGSGVRLAPLLLSHSPESFRGCSFVPSRGRGTSHPPELSAPLPIYEMGSYQLHDSLKLSAERARVALPARARVLDARWHSIFRRVEGKDR